MKINGSLVFDASSASEVQNLRVQKVETNPTWTSADVGRLIYNSALHTIYVGGVADWVALATGGNAAALQTEVDNLETSLGAGVTAAGTFDASAFNGQGPLTGVTSFTNAITQLAAYATGNDTLAELDDVTLTAPADGQYLKYDSGTSKWVNDTLTVSDVTDLTATAAELNILDGATLTVTELNFVDGVTSAIQPQLDGKQAIDAGLTSLAGLSATGIIVQTADNVFNARTLVEPAAGITITNPAGIGGNPTFALSNDLAALEGLGGTGYIVRTADGAATTVSITGTAGNIEVLNGSGVTSDTSIDLAPVTQAASGDFKKITLDGFGRVTGNTAVVTADITALVDGTYVNVAGDTMTGALSMGGFKITTLAAPTADTDAANKAYVDALTAGLSWKQAVRAATTVNVSLSTDLEAGDTLDGVVLAAGDRVLVKNQTAQSENGIYVVQATGAAVRATDMDVAAEFSGAAVFVKEGTAGADSGWTQQAEVTTLGTDNVVWSQFSGSATYTWGTGLLLTGNTVDVNLGAGIAQLPTDEVGIDLRDPTNGALILTSDGSTRSTASGSALYLLLDPAGALVQNSSGLKVNAASVTNAMLVNSGVTFNTDANTPDVVSLGETLQIIGDSIQGIATSGPADNQIKVSAVNATTTQKGVASFSDADFAVSAGVVTIKAAGVDNAQLANSTISISANSGTTDPVALGETLALTGSNVVHTDTAAIIKTTVTDNAVDFSVRAATATLTGVASFPAADFNITAGGSVSIVQKSLTDATDVDDAATPTAGHVLAGNGTAWINKKIQHVHDQTTSSTTWTVVHSLGQKYCNVTVVDSTDNVVIPQSIVFNDTNQLTVTFNTAITGKVVVMGIA